MIESPVFEGIEDKFSFIVESVPSGIVITDGAGRIIFVNSIANKMVGYEKGELHGKEIEVLVPERYRKLHTADRASYTESPSTRMMGQGRDLFALRKDGTEFPVEIGLNPVRTKNGVLVLSTIVDITERKDLERKLLDRTEELARVNSDLRSEIREREIAKQRRIELMNSLEKVNSELSDFAHKVSHDLKAPLRAIGALADWLKEDYADKLDESGVETLDLLKSRVVRMSKLIDGILSYSSAVRDEGSAAEINLKELIDEVVKDLSPAPNVKVTLESEAGSVYYNRTRLEQVFQNLLTNAVKYNDKPEVIVRIGCLRDGGEYRFSVSDNGIGIERKYFDKIFRMFETLAPRDKSETAGIGLAIVKKIIENYGGRIWVESEPGSGTTFYFTLPVSAPQGAEENVSGRGEPLREGV